MIDGSRTTNDKKFLRFIFNGIIQYGSRTLECGGLPSLFLKSYLVDGRTAFEMQLGAHQSNVRCNKPTPGCRTPKLI